MTDPGRIAARGAAWAGGAAAVRLLARAAALYVLARELPTDEFGLAVLVLAITAVAAAGADLGMGVLAVQRRDVDERRALRLAATGGVLAAVALAPVAPALGAVGALVQVAAIGLPLAGAATALRTRLARRLAFSGIARFDSLLALLLAGAQIAFALAGFGAWSVVFAEIGTAAAACAVWGTVAPAPREGKAGGLSGDGLRVVATRAADLIGDRFDRLVLAARLGPTAVGYYGFSFQHAFFAPLQAAPIAEQVGLPVLSRERSAAGTYLRLTRAYALLVVGASVALFHAAPWIVETLYPERWKTAVWPMQVLCVAAAITGLNSQPGLLWLALGRVRLRMTWSLVNAPLLFVFVWIGSEWGVLGISRALVLRHALATVAAQEVTRRVAGVSWPAYLFAIAPAAGVALLFLV